MSYLMDAFKIVSIFISSMQSLTYLQYHYQGSVVGPIIKTLHICTLFGSDALVRPLPLSDIGLLAILDSWLYVLSFIAQFRHKM